MPSRRSSFNVPSLYVAAKTIGMVFALCIKQQIQTFYSARDIR